MGGELGGAPAGAVPGRAEAAGCGGSAPTPRRQRPHTAAPGTAANPATSCFRANAPLLRQPPPTWLVKEQDITKEGWPVAQPRLSRRPSASTITPCPSGKMKRSTWGLMFCLRSGAEGEKERKKRGGISNTEPGNGGRQPCYGQARVGWPGVASGRGTACWGERRARGGPAGSGEHNTGEEGKPRELHPPPQARPRPDPSHRPRRSPLHARPIHQAGHVDLVVKVANVAHNGVVLHPAGGGDGERRPMHMRYRDHPGRNTILPQESPASRGGHWAAVSALTWTCQWP